MLTCLRRKHVDSGVGAARLQPGDPYLPPLGTSWPKIIGPTFCGSSSGQSKELCWVSVGRDSHSDG